MQLGQPADLKNKAVNRGFADRIKIEDGENVHRVLFGPARVDYIYYPTLVENEETGQMEQSTRVIKRPPEGCVLDQLANLEKRIRTKKGEKNVDSSLKAKSKWLYLAIDQAEDEPVVKLAQYPFSVYKDIVQIEEAASKKDPSKLRYGLIFMYDLIITKNVDKTKSRRYGVSYSVEVDPENPWAGKVPTAYLGLSGTELEAKLQKANKSMLDFFTEEEWKAIEANDIDLIEEGRPDTQEEIQQKLSDAPIYLEAKNADGSYVFPSVEEFKEVANELGIDFLGGDNAAPKSLTQGEATPPKSAGFSDSIDTEDYAPDAEVVDDEGEGEGDEPKEPEPEKETGKSKRKKSGSKKSGGRKSNKKKKEPEPEPELEPEPEPDDGFGDFDDESEGSEGFEDQNSSEENEQEDPDDDEFPEW